MAVRCLDWHVTAPTRHVGLLKGDPMKYFALVLLLVSAGANAAQAMWTGRQEMVTTVTYQQAWRCEYNYNGQVFYRIFRTSCPSSVEVE